MNVLFFCTTAVDRAAANVLSGVALIPIIAGVRVIAVVPVVACVPIFIGIPAVDGFPTFANIPAVARTAAWQPMLVLESQVLLHDIPAVAGKYCWLPDCCWHFYC